MSQLKAVITRLSPSCRQSLQQAAKHCIEMGHQEVDILHLLYELVATPDNDVAAILNKNSINQPELQADLQSQLDAWPVSPEQSVVFSTRLTALLQDAWQVASSQANHTTQEMQVKSGHVLVVLLNFDHYQPLLAALPEALRYIDAVALKNDYDKICAQSAESASVASVSDAPANNDSQPAAEQASTFDTTKSSNKSSNNDAQAALDKYTYNLTAQARAGKIDPVIGREFEIHQLIDILIRRRQNNPILTGEAGVGKTAVVEGLAQKIVAKDVPAQLQDVALHTLDLGLLQAGASVKGEFENRLKQVIEAVQSSPEPIILFIDEAHTLIGAGGAAGQNDAANLLKPALARGELRTIAATTWSEYKKYFEKDAALSRRFQVVQVKEPDTETAIAMIRGLSAKMQQHFDIIIEDDALRAAVELSARYISERQLPDKAVSVLDTAAARVSLSKTSIPNAIDKRLATDKQLTLHIQHLDDQLKRVGSAEMQEKLSQKIALLDDERQENKKVITTMTEAWQTQQTLNQQLDALSLELRGALSSDERLDKQAQYQALETALAEAQQAYHLVHAVLNDVVIKQVISDWTGIPLNDMAGDEKERILHLTPVLQQQVIGQDHALEAIVKRIHTAKARLDDPSRPQGIFLLVGPSGVGKTQTAHTLAEVLYGGAQNLITINLSEYQEAHSVALLKGSPPGYVGYGEGGVLTEAVRRRPYSVLLLDEVEKAHPDVLDLFYQVFDKGVMEDGEGRLIDFKNTLILLTSNVGSSTIMQACLNTTGDSEHVLPDSEALKQLINPQLYKDFKPAFLGRLTTIPFYPLTDDALATIIEIKLNKIVARIQTNYGVACQIDPEVIEVILSRCHEVDSGARNADAIINHTLLPQLASQLLAHDDTKNVLERISIGVDDSDGFVYQLTTTPVVPLSQMAQSSDDQSAVREEVLS